MTSATNFAAAVMVDPPFFAPQNLRKPSPPRSTTREHSVRPSLEAIIARFRLAPPQACDNLFILDFIARRSASNAVDVEGRPGWSLELRPTFLGEIRAARPDRHGQGRARAARAHPWREVAALPPEDAASLLSLIAPGSPYVEIPEAEHHVMIDQPLAFVAALRALLAAWPPANRRRSSREDGSMPD